MYSLDKYNNLHIKYNNYYNFTLYKKLLKKVVPKVEYDNPNLNIKLKLDNIAIITSICSKLDFNKIFYNFEIFLEKNDMSVRGINYKNILVLKNLMNNRFIIFGFILQNKYKEMTLLFKNFNNSYQKSIYKDLNYLLFFDNIDTNTLNQLETYLYSYNQSIISNNTIKSNLPIYSLLEYSDDYLKSVITTLHENRLYINDYDLIVIFKDKFYDSIFSENMLSMLDKYYIAGENKKNSIFSCEDDKNLITNLMNKYPNCQFNLENVYADYDFIIISSSFLYTIIEDLINKNINQISIILNFYKYKF